MILMILKVNLLHVHVCLLILLAPGLTIWTVPVDQDHQGYDEQQVRDEEGVGNVGDFFIPEDIFSQTRTNIVFKATYSL